MFVLCMSTACICGKSHQNGNPPKIPNHFCTASTKEVVLQNTLGYDIEEDEVEDICNKGTMSVQKGDILKKGYKGTNLG